MRIKYYKCKDCGQSVGLHQDWLAGRFFYNCHGADYLCTDCAENRILKLNTPESEFVSRFSREYYVKNY